MNSLKHESTEIREYLYFYQDTEQKLTIEPGMITPQMWQLLAGFMSPGSGWQLLKANAESLEGKRRGSLEDSSPLVHILLDPKLQLVCLESHQEERKRCRKQSCDTHLLNPEGYLVNLVTINKGQSQSYLHNTDYYLYKIITKSQEQVLSIILTETPIIPL